MRREVLVWLVLFCAGPCLGGQAPDGIYWLESDSQRVKIRVSGGTIEETWVLAPEAGEKSPSQQKAEGWPPAGWESRIRSKAEEEWPGDFSMQKHTIDQQLAAVASLRRIRSERALPGKVLDSILARSVKEWGGDFTMQFHTVKEQMDAWRALNPTAEDKSKSISKEGASEWSIPGDVEAIIQANIESNPMANSFTMKKMLRDAEREAVDWLQGGPPSGVPKKIYREMRKNIWSNPMASSFTMKKMLLSAEIDSWRELQGR